MSIPAKSLSLVKRFEGLHKKLRDGSKLVGPYLDSGGVCTIGYGCIEYPDGTPVRMTDEPITRERCTELLAWELAAKERAVDLYVTRPLDPLSRGACVSFAFNCGSGKFKRSPLRKHINAGDWDAVHVEWGKYIRDANGVVQPGLVRRRLAERKMFMEGVKALARTPVPSATENAFDGLWAAFWACGAARGGRP